MRYIKYFIIVFMLFMFAGYSAFANNISVSNFSLTGQNAQSHYAMIKFDISWENSWRTSAAPNNWDAAWVFVKYRVNVTGEWQHAWLNNTGHVNPAGSTISTGLLKTDSAFHQTTNPGIGVFIYRDADDTGTFSKTGVQLRWNYGANGVPDIANIDIRVFAIEQVFVPQGSFYAGSGGTDYYAFYKYPTTTNPYQITSEGQIPVGNQTGNLYYLPGRSGDGLGPIPTAFPKGYSAFYCMKYEISQQGYVDFLNSLTQTQATIRKYTYSLYRYAITGSVVGSYATTNPCVACNYISWSDLAAYLDWSGLRPMTELEFEKACRGTIYPLPNEYVWGTTGVVTSIYTLINGGLINENIGSNYSTSLGNSGNISTIWNSGIIRGPVRVGIFAGNSLNSGRITSGATYYGIMEMGGNLEDRVITVGNTIGRSYIGTHGNGLLTSIGDADVYSWPDTTAAGAGCRGGCYQTSPNALQISSRRMTADTVKLHNSNFGGRGVRLEPIQ